MPPIDYERAAEVSRELEERLVESLEIDLPVSRREMLGGLGAGIAGSASLAGVGDADPNHGSGDDEHGNFGAVGEYEESSFDPHEFLYEFNTGKEDAGVNVDVYEEGGQTVREFTMTAVDVKVE
ncbi:MAG: copper oxidase, partial [Halobacteria archaeon]|nr:copper oxidase [Halobacteria archaeon]